MAQGKREKAASICRQVEDHGSLEVVGQHHPRFIEEWRGNDQVPAVGGLLQDLLELGVLQCAPENTILTNDPIC